MNLGDIPFGIWSSMVLAIVALAWFLGEDATHERRYRQLVRLEKILLWAAAVALVAGAIGLVGFVLWRWLA